MCSGFSWSICFKSLTQRKVCLVLSGKSMSKRFAGQSSSKLWKSFQSAGVRPALNVRTKDPPVGSTNGKDRTAGVQRIASDAKAHLWELLFVVAGQTGTAFIFALPLHGPQDRLDGALGALVDSR